MNPEEAESFFHDVLADPKTGQPIRPSQLGSQVTESTTPSIRPCQTVLDLLAEHKTKQPTKP